MTSPTQTTSPSPENYLHYLSFLARIQVLERHCRGTIRESDVVQQTLTNAWRKREQFRGTTEAEFKGWLRTILARTLTAAINSPPRRREIPLSVLQRAIEESSRRLIDFAASQSSPSQIVTREEQIEEAVAELLA